MIFNEVKAAKITLTDYVVHFLFLLLLLFCLLGGNGSLNLGMLFLVGVDE